MKNLDSDFPSKFGVEVHSFYQYHITILLQFLHQITQNFYKNSEYTALPPITCPF